MKAKDIQPIKILDAAQQAVRAESAPATTRRYRAVLFLIALVIVAGAFAVLTLFVKTTPSFTIDLEITRAIQSIRFPPFTWLMTMVSWLGFTPQSIIIAGVTILLIFLVGLQWEALVAILAATLSTTLSMLLKQLVQRPRPTAALVNVHSILNDFSFPSGHVMYYVGFFGFLGFLAFSLLKPSVKRSLLLVLLGSLVALVGASRIYLGQHWASDVLGAYLLGSLTLAALIMFYRWGKTRFFVHQPVAADRHRTIPE